MITEYQPPTGGTTKQEIMNGFLLFLCPDAGRKEATIRHATMPAGGVKDFSQIGLQGLA